MSSDTPCPKKAATASRAPSDTGRSPSTSNARSYAGAVPMFSMNRAAAAKPSDTCEM